MPTSPLQHHKEGTAKSSHPESQVPQNTDARIPRQSAPIRNSTIWGWSCLPQATMLTPRVTVPFYLP